ncbi:MAG: PDZ domain-containing protein [Pirellulales bacterium]
MKLVWKLGHVATGLSLMASPIVAQEAKEAKEARQVIVVQGHPLDGQESSGEKKVHVAVVEAQGKDKKQVLDKVLKQLDESGVDGEKRAKVLAAIEKAMASKDDQENKVVRLEVRAEESKSGDSQPPESKKEIEVQVNREVVVLDKDGKQQKIVLQQAKPQVQTWVASPAQGGQIKIQTHIHDEMKEKVKKQLEENGVDAKVIEKVMKSLESVHGKVNTGVTHHFGGSGGPGAFSFSTADAKPRYVIGVALGSDEDDDDDDDKEGEQKLIVKAVYDDSPAAKAGIEVEDVIVKVDGKKIGSPSDLIAHVQEAGKEDRVVKIILDRSGKEKTVDIKPRKESAAISITSDNMGQIEHLPKELKKAFEGLSGEMKGFVLPPNAKGVPMVIPGPPHMNKEMESVKEELSELRAELKELKSLIKSLKQDK